jgi:hypothetical protein
MTLRINLPRDIKANNPAALYSHSLHIVIHAFRVNTLEYNDMTPGKSLCDFNTNMSHFHNESNKLYPLMAIEIQSMSALISGGAVPPLISKELDKQVADLIQAVRQADNCQFRFIICTDDPLLKDIATAFQAAHITE